MTEENIEEEMDIFPILSPPSGGDGILNEDGTGDHILLETGDHILLEGAAAAAVEYRRRLIMVS